MADGDDSLKLDRRLRLDHILTWLVSGLAAGLCTALLWVHRVDKEVAALQQEVRYQRERTDVQNTQHIQAVQGLASRFDRFEEKLERIASLKDRGKREP